MGHGSGSAGGGAGRRGAYQESHGEDAGGGGAAKGAAEGGPSKIAGNGAVNGWDGAAPPVTGRPQDGQN